MAICGQRCGLDITATTAMPEAVRTGFALSSGRSCFLYCSGTPAMICVSLGTPCSLFFAAASCFRRSMFTARPCLYAVMSSDTMSLIVPTSACMTNSQDTQGDAAHRRPHTRAAATCCWSPGGGLLVLGPLTLRTLRPSPAALPSPQPELAMLSASSSSCSGMAPRWGASSPAQPHCAALPVTGFVASIRAHTFFVCEKKPEQLTARHGVEGVRGGGRG